jgi:hypothetical protein
MARRRLAYLSTCSADTLVLRIVLSFPVTQGRRPRTSSLSWAVAGKEEMKEREPGRGWAHLGYKNSGCEPAKACESENAAGKQVLP